MAVGDRTTLNTLFLMLRNNLLTHDVSPNVRPTYREFRAGDVRHSQAATEKAQSLLGYAPSHTLEQGIAEAVDWYLRRLKASKAPQSCVASPDASS